MGRMIDLRSDTVTTPTERMREAMACAEVGDDVFGEDPTVNRLEALASEITGKEASVFLTSGTMGNLIGVLTHCSRGEEVIVGEESHIFWNEAAGTAVVGGVQLRIVPDDDGAPVPLAVASAIRPDDIHFPRSALVCLENTHNRHGGLVVSLERTRDVAKVVHDRGLRLHLDGARIFNAALFLDMSARDLVAPVDSVTFCLSKGLSAPVGALLCGDRAYIARARRLRKMLGGGMRQAGVLAAAGIVALQEMVGRLVDDHANARRLADGLSGLPRLSVDLGRVQTNIVVVKLDRMTSADLLGALAELGVRGSRLADDRIRLVTHYGITQEDVDLAVRACARAVKQLFK